MRTVYANALLSDGKILFWYTGNECKDWHDFYKDFYYAGLNMTEYEKSHGSYEMGEGSWQELYERELNECGKYKLTRLKSCGYAKDDVSEDYIKKQQEQNPNLKYESCAESISYYTHKVGCISKNDLIRLGIENKYMFTGLSNQRFGCLCPCQKLELLNKNYQCEHKCVYCYWKDKK